MRKTIAAAVMVVASVLAGLGVATVTVGAQAAEGRVGSAVELRPVDQAGTAAHGQDKYFSINSDVRQARAACYRTGQPDVPSGSTAEYTTWYNNLSAAEHAHWDAVFANCQLLYPATYPGNFHEVTREVFYSKM